MSLQVLDSLRADHPDPDEERTLILVAAAGGGPVDGHVLPKDLDPDRLESWDGVFRALLRDNKNGDENGDENDEVAITFTVTDPTRLATLFYAAVTWLGLVDSRLRSVRLRLDETADEGEMAAAFAREKERHLRLHEIDLPEVEWLAPEHQYNVLARSAWDYASAADKPEGLSIRQTFAIRLYTSEFYLAFHNALRPARGDHPVYRELLPIIASLDAGLENLPPVSGSTFRGERWDSETAESRRKLEKDSEFGELSYLSSSHNELHAAALRRGFLFRIRGHTGRDISTLSEFPWEREVLFGRGLLQRVLSKDCSDQSIGEECDFETEEASPSRWQSLAGRGSASSERSSGPVPARFRSGFSSFPLRSGS